MKSILKKVICLFLILITYFSIYSIPVRASILDFFDFKDLTNPTSETGDDASADTDDEEWLDVDDTFGKKSSKKGLNNLENEVGNMLGNSIAIMQVVGVGIAIFMLMTLGMKYMMASVEERAKIKEHAMVYVIGALVFFSAAGILQIIQGFIKDNFK